MTDKEKLREALANVFRRYIPDGYSSHPALVTDHNEAFLEIIFEAAQAHLATLVDVVDARDVIKDIEDGVTTERLRGIRCGVEDRDLYDRYECAEYGFSEGIEYALSCLPTTGHFTAPPADAQRVDVQALKRETEKYFDGIGRSGNYRPMISEVIDHLATTGRLAGIPEGYVLISEELVQFLNGEGTLDGWGFGERPAKSGVFWWRKYLPKTQEEK